MIVWSIWRFATLPTASCLTTEVSFDLLLHQCMSFGLYKCYILRSDLYYYSHLVASINEALHTGDYTNCPELLSSAALLVWSLVTYWSVWSKNSELCKFKVPVGRVSTSRRQIGQQSVVYRWTVCGVCIVNRCFAGITAVSRPLPTEDAKKSFARLKKIS